MAIDPVREFWPIAARANVAGAGFVTTSLTRRLRCFAFVIMDRYGIAGPVHGNVFLAGTVLLPQHHILIPIPPLI